MQQELDLESRIINRKKDVSFDLCCVCERKVLASQIYNSKGKIEIEDTGSDSGQGM